MKLSDIGVALGLAAAMVGSTSYAGEHRRESKDHRRASAGMQVVPVSPGVGEPGHGWRYFSDAREACAVVISPRGDYYYSDGEGLRLVFRPMPAAA